MKFPYQRLHLCSGDILVAARGGKLSTFSTRDGSQLGTWSHPQEGKITAAAAATAEGTGVDAQNGTSVPDATENGGDGSEAADQGPPAKRRKVVAGDGAASEEAGTTLAAAASTEAGTPGGDAREHNGQAAATNGKKKNGGRRHPPRLISEWPFVTLLASTTDGRHIVAVTSPDKNLWVFSHDEHGQLQELSQRQMPKRPCAIAVSPDDKTIFSADKFGDVYSLPLIPSADSEQAPAPPTPSEGGTSTPNPSSPAPSSTTAAPSFKKPAADPSTVHTKRNLRALQHQTLYGPTSKPRAEGPSFAHTLLLGHVSMLTDMVLATSAANNNSRPHILTADRDEHIRASRGNPSQAHVVETFCLGHEQFVSRLLPAPGGGGDRTDVLISGGGDDSLFVWEWEQGRLASTADLLQHVRAVEPSATKLAVTGLYALSRGEECYVLVFCERIPAAFTFTLSARPSNTLTHHSTVRLPGYPLDAVPIPTQGEFIISLDRSSAPAAEDQDTATSFVVLSEPTASSSADKASWSTSTFTLHAAEEIGSSSPDVTADELHKLLYTTESLRKSDAEEASSRRNTNAGGSSVMKEE